MKLDILVMCAHPDDAELGCSATLMKHKDLGYKVGIIDLTAGELGTRGTPEIRAEESMVATKLMNLDVRDNLNFRDGWFKNDDKHKFKIIEQIRKYQPEILITNAPQDRHPDHGRASALVVEAAWLSGLFKIETTDAEGKAQEAWRPKKVLHFIQYMPLTPDIVVEVNDYVERKMEVVKAFKSQFYDPQSNEPSTFIAGEGFLNLIKSRMAEIGSHAMIDYGEGFISAFKPALNDLFDLQ